MRRPSATKSNSNTSDSFPDLAIRRISQRVKMVGHATSDADVRRRFKRSLINLIQIYAPLADT